MKFLLTASLLSIGLFSVQAQILPGIRTSDHNGILGTFTNPANVANNKYSWDVNLFGVAANTGIDGGKIKLSDIGKENFLREKVLGTEGYRSGVVNLDVAALGFMMGIGKKHGLAITTRGRMYVNATDLNARLINDAIDGNTGTYPYTIAPGKAIIINASVFTDYGLTWASQLVENGPHYLKAGATVKYVSGVGNVHFNTNISGTLNEDPNDGAYITNTNGQIGVRSGGAAFGDDFELNQLLEFNGGGLGLDLGFTYEYRPASWNNADTKKALRAHGHTPYKFKVGVSLMDIGKVQYTPDSANSKNYNAHIANNQRFYLTAFDETDVDNFTSAFDAYPQYFTRTARATDKYKVALPTSLLINFDYNIGKRFFVNAEGRIALKKQNTENIVRSYTSVAITPRYDGRMVGVFLPITIHELSGLNVGAALSIGPLYVGSGSIFSLLTGGSKQADAFVGLRFGGLRAKQKVRKNTTVLDEQR